MKTLVTFLALGFSLLATAQLKTSINTDKSIINWKGSNLLKFNTHYGTVNFKNGVLEMDGTTLIGGAFEIDMNTIKNTDGKYNEMLVNHLKGEDFFEVETFPNSKLEIKKAIDKGNNIYQVIADLTIKEVTNEISFRAKVENSSDTSVLNSKFIIDRTLWHVTYSSKGILSSVKDDVISDAIEFDVKIEWVNN